MKKNDVLEFGNYYSDSEGKTKEPISWLVLDVNDERVLLISEKIIEYLQFSFYQNNNWDESELKKWLNTVFVDLAFNSEEKERMLNLSNDERISLLSLEECGAYFLTYNSAKALLTDYAKDKAEKYYKTTIKKPHGFWWLKTANKNGLGGEWPGTYVYHVCDNGSLNCFEASNFMDGVRPVISLKRED